MISRKNRFIGQRGVRYLFKNGNTLRGQYITTRYLSNPKKNNYRAAVVVSKKVTKSAPKRNRIRRRVYEIIRLNAAKFLNNQDLAIIVFNDKLADMPYEELENLVLEHLKQISKSFEK